MADQNESAEDLRRRLDAERRKFQQFVQIATALNSTLNIQDLLQLILASASDLVGADHSSLLLLDEDTGELVFHTVAGETDGSVAQRRVPAGKGIAGWTLQHNQPVVLDDPASDERFYAGIGEAVGVETRNLVAVPLSVKERAIGVVEVMNKRGSAGFSDADVELATALAALASVAIDNATLYARLADAVISARLSYRL